MKIRAVTLALCFFARVSLAQGTFVFETYLPPGEAGPEGVNSPVYDRDGATLLSGARYSAQFYAGASDAMDGKGHQVEVTSGEQIGFFRLLTNPSP